LNSLDLDHGAAGNVLMTGIRVI